MADAFAVAGSLAHDLVPDSADQVSQLKLPRFHSMMIGQIYILARSRNL